MHIVLGLLLALALIAVYHMTTRTTRRCRWRADRTKDRDGQHCHYCAACGAETYTTSEKPPRVCHAGQV